jgi:hypothetical protein
MDGHHFEQHHKIEKKKKREAHWWGEAGGFPKQGVEDEAVAQSGPTFSTTGVQRS